MRSQPPDPRLIYARTPAGDAETSARALELSPTARRILALVDARRSVGDLSLLARPGELAPVLAVLERLVLVEAVALAAEPTEAQRRERERAEQARLQAIKAALRDAFAGELGIVGRIWDARIADSVNLDVLRRALREAIDAVELRRGEAAVQRVLAIARPLFDSAFWRPPDRR
ncbi:MAG: hypothetical protein ROZ64_06375 [Burkholderiaceae bacterium]|nr:hypothetical protein [Burkholderiaceae bacterium]